jgi:hypothetical protein
MYMYNMCFLLFQGSDDCKNISPTKNRQILKSEEVIDFNEITEMVRVIVILYCVYVYL